MFLKIIFLCRHPYLRDHNPQKRLNVEVAIPDSIHFFSLWFLKTTQLYLQNRPAYSGRYNLSINNLDTEKELHLRISRGDETAVKELFAIYYNSLVFFSERILGLKEDAEDVVVQVFTKLWINREQLPTVNQLKPFLYTTVKNASLDLMRQQKKVRTQQVSDDFWKDKATDDDLNIEATKAEVVRIIHDQINNLPDKCKQVFWLSYIEGLSTQRVADTLGISVSNVTSQRSRAIQLLRKSILEKQLWAILLFIIRQF